MVIFQKRKIAAVFLFPAAKKVGGENRVETTCINLSFFDEGIELK